MKKFLTILFALLLALSALSFAACGSDSSKDPDNPDNPGKAEIYTISYEFGDMEGKAENETGVSLGRDRGGAAAGGRAADGDA